ncbi:hypothetical protein D3C87_1167680 [compost metagenome]
MPRTGFGQRVLPCFFESAFGDAEEHMSERELGDQRAQAGERCTQRTRIEQQFRLFDPYPFERGTAAVGLALAHVVPVVVQGDAAAPAGDCGDQQLAAGTFVHRRGDQHFRIAGAGAETFLAGKLTPAAEFFHHGAGVERVEGVAPEPVLARGLFKPRLPLFRPGEQAHGGKHQVMKAEYMGNRTVDLGELAHNGQGFTPTGAEAAQLGGNAQGEQTAVAQGVTLGLGCTATLVALDGGQGKLRRQMAGGLQRGYQGAVRLGSHAGFLIERTL